MMIHQHVYDRRETTHASLFTVMALVLVPFMEPEYIPLNEACWEIQLRTGVQHLSW